MTSWIVSLTASQSFRVGAFLPSARIRPMISMDRIFKRPFLWPELYRSPGKVSIPVLLDEKSTVVPVRLAGEQSGGKRKWEWARGSDQRKVLRLTGTIWVMRLFETSGLSAKLITNGQRSLSEMSCQCETHGGRKQLQLAV